MHEQANSSPDVEIEERARGLLNDIGDGHTRLYDEWGKCFVEREIAVKAMVAFARKMAIFNRL